MTQHSSKRGDTMLVLFLAAIFGSMIHWIFTAAVIAIQVGLLLYGFFWATRKSRKAVAQYRQASPAERYRLDEEMKSDSNLMRPVSWWETAIAFGIAALGILIAVLRQ